VTLISTAASSRPSSAIASVPTGASMPIVDSRRMPSWSSPRPSSLRRGDHAVGHVAVGLARGDRERAGQHRARQRHDDLVADEEVARAADDAVHRGAAVGRGLAVGRDAHLAPADGLAVGLRLLDELEHLAHDDRALQLEAVHVLLLEADLHEGGVHVLGVGSRHDSTYSRAS
jgi:hypothetical protein